MDIAPIILRLHPELDARQREVIGHGSGPLLVIAGPGAGKTRCVALRAVNLLLTGQTAPEELTLCSFGRDTARELQQRFTRYAQACGVPGDLSRVRINTVHSLCHQVIVSNAAMVGLRPEYKLLGEREQHLLLQQEFAAIFGPDWDTLAARGWRDGTHTVGEAARYFDRICDGMIEADALAGSGRPFIAALGRCLRRYRALLLAKNAVDLSHLQVWAEQVLRRDDAAAKQGGVIRHLMVDEFQDTSHVQMRILHRLGEFQGNIAVVGDDDQSIYRFRGASVANLLQFPLRFPGCRVLELSTNYRSHPGIVAASREWMATAAGWEVDGRCYRYAKALVAHTPETHPDHPAVISVQGQDPLGEARQLGELLRFLRDNGVIASYGQAALLLHSVKEQVSGPYLDGLESAGIPVRCEPAGHAHGPADDKLLVTTIHQAKGREWEVVVVGSLCGPDLETDRIGRNLAGSGVYSGEPEGLIAGFDRARQHYVAFTRARRLLVLTASGEPQARFRSIWEGSACWSHMDRESLSRQRFGMAGTEPTGTVIDIARLDRLVVRLAPPR